MSSSKISLGAINMTARDAKKQAGFWAAVTGNQLFWEGDFYYLEPSGPEGFGLMVQANDQASTTPQAQGTHMDLTVPWGSREQEVQRIIALGATYQWEVLEEYDHVRWTTLADPEGNLFCIAEHPPAK